MSFYTFLLDIYHIFPQGSTEPQELHCGAFVMLAKHISARVVNDFRSIFGTHFTRTCFRKTSDQCGRGTSGFQGGPSGAGGPSDDNVPLKI